MKEEVKSSSPEIPCERGCKIVNSLALDKMAGVCREFAPEAILVRWITISSQKKTMFVSRMA